MNESVDSPQSDDAITPEFRDYCGQISESELYHVINALGGYMWRTSHDINHGMIELTPELDLERIQTQKKVQYAVDQTTRFGLTQPRTEEGHPTPEYWKWFKWWDSYFKGMSEKDWRSYDRALKAQEDVTMWWPTGDWEV